MRFEYNKVTKLEADAMDRFFPAWRVAFGWRRKMEFPDRIVLAEGWPRVLEKDTGERVYPQSGITMDASRRRTSTELLDIDWEMCEHDDCPKYRLVLERVDVQE